MGARDTVPARATAIIVQSTIAITLPVVRRQRRFRAESRIFLTSTRSSGSHTMQSLSLVLIDKE
jgi:hypothetical protein